MSLEYYAHTDVPSWCLPVNAGWVSEPVCPEILIAGGLSAQSWAKSGAGVGNQPFASDHDLRSLWKFLMSWILGVYFLGVWSWTLLVLESNDAMRQS